MPLGSGEAAAQGEREPRPVLDLEDDQDATAAEEPHPAEEARAAKPARDPGAPTQAMIDAHAATHLPYWNGRVKVIGLIKDIGLTSVNNHLCLNLSDLSRRTYPTYPATYK